MDIADLDWTRIEVDKVEDHPDGSATITFNVSDEFIEWFKRDQGLEKWSQKRFEQWVTEAIQNSLDKLKDEGLLKDEEGT